jgi:serine/threonine protein kinase
VLKALWVAKNQFVALKVEKPQSVSKCIIGNAPEGYLTIEHEWRMMEAMNRTDGFPLVYTSNFSGKYKYYVMQMLGKTLSSIRKSSPEKRIKTRQLIHYAHQMLDRIEALHNRDALMYDIHLGNFLVDSSDKVFVIDLGMAIPFRYKNGKHVNNGRGTVPNTCKNAYYVSRNDGLEKAVSRRDDLERLFYLLVDLSINSLPWKDAKDWEQRQAIKRSSKSSDICVHEAQWLQPALDHVFSLGFTEKPNYRLLHDIFDDRLAQLNLVRKMLR